MLAWMIQTLLYGPPRPQSPVKQAPRISPWHEPLIPEVPLSPIYTLPAELLALIFLHATPNLLSTHEAIYIPGVVFGRVCRLWRQTAYSSPHIWANITIHASFNTTGFGPPGLPRLTTALHKLLDLSANSPLSLDIDLDSESFLSVHRQRHELPQAFLSPLSQHSHRWRSLKLDTEYTVLLEDTGLDGLLPQLEYLDLKVTRSPYNHNDTVYPPYTGFQSTPKLRHMTLRWKRDPDVQLPWNQIEHLSYFGVECLDDLTQVLAEDSASQLQSLTVVDVFSYCKCPSHASVTSNLTSLTIGIETQTAPSMVFAHLTLPHLETLTFFAKPTSTKRKSASSLRSLIVETPHWLKIDIMESFFQRSQCQILELVLDGVSVNNKAIYKLLHLVPKLHTLRVVDAHTNSIVSSTTHMLCDILNIELASRVSRISIHKDNFPPLPLLKHISLTTRLGPADTFFGGMTLIDMVGSRRRANSNQAVSSTKFIRLETVRLQFMGTVLPSPTLLRRLGYLQQGGLKVILVD